MTVPLCAPEPGGSTPTSCGASWSGSWRPAAAGYLSEVRAEALEVLRKVSFEPERPLLADGYVYRMIVQHEAQHQETMLQALDLRAAADPYPPAAARSLPAARPVA